MQKQIQAKQSQQIAELTKLDNELCAAISFAKHNSKSAKELATKMSEVSSKMFLQLNGNDLLGINDIQRDRLDLTIDMNKKYTDPNFYTAFIEHMASAIKNNWKIFADEQNEQSKNVSSQIGSKSEVFEGMHFWHEVLQETRQKNDDFSTAIIIHLLASRHGKFGLLQSVNKDMAEYLKKFSNDFASFTTEYEKDKNKTENIKNQNMLIDACFKADPTISSSKMLFQIMKFYKENERQDKKQEKKEYRDDVLQYQFLALQAKYLDFVIAQKEKPEVANKTKNSQEREEDLQSMHELLDKALKVADARLEKWEKLIKTSNHEELIQRYNEKFILLGMKDKLIDSQKKNLTAMKMLHMTAKEPPKSLVSMEQIHKSQQQMVKDKEFILLERPKLKDELKTISEVGKFVDKIEKFRSSHNENKSLSEQEHENNFNLLRQELLGFQESINTPEFKKNHKLLSESVDRMVNELLIDLENKFNHGKIQILSRPGNMQHEIEKLKNDYEIHMANMKNPDTVPQAINGVHAVRERVEQLEKIISNPNFLIKAEISKFQDQLSSLKSNLPQKPISQIETPKPQEVTVQNSTRPSFS